MLFSNRDLTRIIFPLVIEKVLTVTIGMLDTVMVSRVGEAAVSGVSLVDSINLFMVYAFGALSSGGAVIISQILGTGDKEYAFLNSERKYDGLIFKFSARADILKSLSVNFFSISDFALRILGFILLSYFF